MTGNVSFVLVLFVSPRVGLCGVLYAQTPDDCLEFTTPSEPILWRLQASGFCDISQACSPPTLVSEHKRCPRQRAPPTGWLLCSWAMRSIRDKIADKSGYLPHCHHASGVSQTISVLVLLASHRVGLCGVCEFGRPNVAVQSEWPHRRSCSDCGQDKS